MSSETADLLKTIVYVLLGTGGATFLWTAVKSVIAYRNSAEGREDKAVARLERFEEDCRRQLQFEREMGAYWWRCVGILQHQLDLHGIRQPDLPAKPSPTLTFRPQPDHAEFIEQGEAAD